MKYVFAIPDDNTQGSGVHPVSGDEELTDAIDELVSEGWNLPSIRVVDETNAKKVTYNVQ